MKITYDPEAEALCLIFREARIVKDTEISPDVFAGFSRSGELVEIQVLDLSKANAPWITVEAAAKLLDKSERTILRWIHSGKLKYRKVGKEYRIDPTMLNDLVS